MSTTETIPQGERLLELVETTGQVLADDYQLSWEEVSGRGDPRQRYRIYRLLSTDDDPYLLGTCETEAAVGVSICTMAREGQLQDAAVGVLDTMGEKGQRWLVNPYAPARHVDA